MSTDTQKKSGGIHPYSSGLLIVLDNVFFGANAMTMGLGTPVIALVAFFVTGTGAFLAQRFLAEEETGPSLARGFFIGALAGVPTSITGTGAGLALLARSGLRRLLKS